MCITSMTRFSFLLGKNSGAAFLKLHPDQIAGLGYYRNWLLHTCTINIQYPDGEIRIEILIQGNTVFTNMNVTFETTTDVIDTLTCSITRTAEFGITFTSDMNNAIIRCREQRDSFPNDPVLYSNNVTVSLIPCK